MDKFQKLHDEQDKFIKEVFSKDKIVSQPVLEDFTEYIENSTIKVNKYTYKQKKLTAFLSILLILSIASNLYLAFTPTSKNEESTNLNNNFENTINNLEHDELNEFEEFENNLPNTSSTPSKTDVENNSSTSTTIVTPKDNTKDNSFDNINLDELRSLIQSYSLGINRLSTDTENLESNTILLFIAKEYFDNRPSTSSLSNNTIYASTAENIHKYLEELTGNDYSDIDYIPSYNNYIGYTPSSKAYVFGPNSSTITKEKYECTDVKITQEINDVYTALAKITRTVDDVKTNYDIEITFELNSNYTYQKYNIKSLKSRNTSFYPDNTVRLISQSDVVIEEDEN